MRSKADFISAAYDIKSGIASLSDEGVAEFTSLAALTAKATKSTAGEMTSLFATGYGIYKDYYSDLSDMEFDPSVCRNIAVDIRYVLFVIDRIGGASYLLQEMEIR